MKNNKKEVKVIIGTNDREFGKSFLKEAESKHPEVRFALMSQNILQQSMKLIIEEFFKFKQEEDIFEQVQKPEIFSDIAQRFLGFKAKMKELGFEKRFELNQTAKILKLSYAELRVVLAYFSMLGFISTEDSKGRVFVFTDDLESKIEFQKERIIYLKNLIENCERNIKILEHQKDESYESRGTEEENKGITSSEVESGNEINQSTD